MIILYRENYARETYARENTSRNLKLEFSARRQEILHKIDCICVKQCREIYFRARDAAGMPAGNCAGL
jgi:hypothetical protein